jgi:hypothetical protein
MRRRDFVRSLIAAVFASKGLAAQEAAKPQLPIAAPVPWTLGLNPKTPIPHTTVAEGIAEAKLSFFTAPQMESFKRLCDLLMPASGDRPGAVQADYRVGPRGRHGGEDSYREGHQLPDAERRPGCRRQHDAERKPAYELPYRGFKPPGRLEHVFQANEFNANVWVDEQEVPYTFDPANPYNWVRVRLFGGRSLFWSRQSFRLSDYEFKASRMMASAKTGRSATRILRRTTRAWKRSFQVAGALDGPPQMPDGNFMPR